ncbi:MAG: cryptochrome/photolyase family protein [Planctomycetota bacterium]
MTTRAIWWVRRDMRLDDNGALLKAAKADAMLAVYVHAQAEEGAWPLGGAQRWWLARSLASLDRALREAGSRLVILDGEAAKVLVDLARSVGASEVVWSRRFEPSALAQERRVEEALDRAGIAWSGFNTNRLFDPEEIATKEGRPYQVYTPFSRSCRARPAPAQPRSAPSSLPSGAGAPKGLALADLDLEPKPDWAGEIAAMWSPGEEGAKARLARFAAGPVAQYPEGRDNPSTEGSSLLSPHLAFGEIGIRRVWHAAARAKAPAESVDKFHSELLWREFATHVLYHFPHTDLKPLRADYAKFPWRTDAKGLRAWQKGGTGYPLVDAGMRQLWRTGWMHNRVRMVVASFLVKHMLLPWQDGARWFWDTLVDADLANNSLGWQWAAGCGADAAPYFRIFNPTSQAEKFDAKAVYIKRWVPELGRLGPEAAREPWEAPPLALSQCGVSLGDTYPRPIVDHAKARERALAALAAVSKKG